MRGVYGRDSTPSGVGFMRAVGFDTVTAMPYRADLDELAREGLGAVVWLGEYHRTRRCRFEFDDALVRERMAEIARHPAVVAYQIADEPNYARVEGCDAVSDLRRRADLVASLDPSKPTYVTISTWDGREGYPYRYFVGTADIMGLVVYPCSRVWDRSGGCRFEMIDRAKAEADRQGVTRYWAVIQAFDDGWYRNPDAWELREQFERWSLSRREGYFVYHWNHGDLESRPAHLAVLAEQNLKASTGP